MNVPRVFYLFALAGLLLPITVHATPAERLLGLINAYRADPRSCAGVPDEPLPPLAPDQTLAQLNLDDGVSLQKAMREAGYQASRAQLLKISGPSQAEEAMRFAAQHHCSVLLSQRYTVAGVSQRGREWHVVLAQPLLDAGLGDWREAGQQVLKRVNAVRARARSCGNQHYRPAPALRWNARLGAAALAHSRDMAKYDYFGHAGRDGSTAPARATDAGYTWRSIGENVAAGQGSVNQVVDGWLSSPGHCANIMSDKFTDMGAAYATHPNSKASIYWTQVFGMAR